MVHTEDDVGLFEAVIFNNICNNSKFMMIFMSLKVLKPTVFVVRNQIEP